MKRLVLILPLLLLLTGCPAQTPEVLARDSIVGAKTFLDKEKAAHPECPGQAPLCQLLTRATGAKDVTIDALEVYCSGPTFESGGACNPPIKGTPIYEQSLTKLTAALSSMNQVIADIKTLEAK